MSRKLPVGIVAPSNVLPQIEFELGLDLLRETGFHPIVHPQCRKKHFLFAGTDKQRAEAFYSHAVDPRFSIVWCARGGYGAARLLPLLEAMTAERGVPERKLLVGYSDATALMEYVRKRWGWATLHGPMPAMRKFTLQKADEWGSLLRFIVGEAEGSAGEEEDDATTIPPWEKKALRWLTAAPKRAIEGALTGGNLAVWASLVGTPYLGSARGKIVFLEDVDEPLYRLDRMIRQVVQAGGLKDVRAIVLGDFLNCRDTVSKVLAVEPKTDAQRKRLLEEPKAEELRPLRKKVDDIRGLRQIFADVGNQLGIPVAQGLPVGHGPGLSSLPLGAQYRLDPKGRFKLKSWDWQGPSSEG